MPKVSIVIPVWGEYKKFLNNCLESVKRQTYKDYEVIVVENKTDLPSARNEGICRATGEYIMPLDVDDELRADYLEKTVGKGDIVTTAHFGAGNKKAIPVLEVNLADLKRHNVVIACSLFKKKVWEDIGGYDEKLTVGWEDWDFWLRAMLKGYKIETVNEPLYHYKQRKGSMVTKMGDTNKIKQYILNKI